MTSVTRAALHRIVRILVLVLALTARACAEDSRVHDEFTLHGYLPDYRPKSFGDAACALPHARVLAFSAYPTPSGDGLLNAASLSPARGTCGTDLVVGGGGRGGDGFAAATRGGAASVSRLAAVVADAVVKGGFHGVSFDWEYPQLDEEWIGYAELLRATRRALDAAETGERKLALSLAIHPLKSTFDALKKFGIIDVVDWVHVMAYDNFGDPKGHATVSSAEELMKYTRSTMSVSKFTLGIPFYARALGNPGDVKTYEEIRRDLGEDFDPTWNRHGAYAYDSVHDVQKKVRLARAAGYAGVMIWELGQDVDPSMSGGSLLGAIAEEVARMNARVRDEL